MSWKKDIVQPLGGLIIIASVIFAAGYFAYYFSATFNPLFEQVRFDTFKQSQSYNDGMLRELRRLQIEYHKAEAVNDSAGVALLRSTILTESASYDAARLPADLREFITKLRG